MKVRISLAVVLSAVLLYAFSGNTAIFRTPPSWPSPSYDFEANPYSANKVALGRTLFYDPLLSQDQTISCASCHSPFNAFAHTDHALSHGIHDSIGFRNAPGLFNLAWQNKFMWDGAIHHLDMQALAPISNPAEMGEDIHHVVEKLNDQPNYRKAFYLAFRDSTITGQHLLQALSQFMVSLISANSRYDSVMRGETHFSVQEENGYRIFKADCGNCHQEPLFTRNSFERNGLAIDAALNDVGRARVSHQSSDSMSFKVPSLRNLEYTAPYMHDGRFKRLPEVIRHYAKAMERAGALSREPHHPVNLDEKSQVDLIAFLLTLSDHSFILNRQQWDPRFGESTYSDNSQKQ